MAIRPPSDTDRRLTIGYAVPYYGDMQTAGVVLDVYDDVSGRVLQSILGVEKTAGLWNAIDDFAGSPAPSALERLPRFLKAASLLPPEQYAALPDRDFALILDNGGPPLRKYAVHNQAHTALSTLYFLNCSHLLPREAQKVAATNLAHAHQWYDMNPPEALLKQADLIGTDVMPVSTSPSKVVRSNPNKRTTTASKLGSVDPYVDVHNLFPAAQFRERVPVHTCLGGEYPIDTYEQVKTAESYFHENLGEFTPLERREYAVTLTKRASDLGIPLEGRVVNYAGMNFGDHLFEEIEKRAASFEGQPQAEVYRTLQQKIASGIVSPDMAVAALHQADCAFGLDHAYGKAVVGFLDPIEAVYGVEKTALDAAEADSNDSYTWSAGSDYVTGEGLRLLSGSETLVKGVFDAKVQRAFEESPVTTFKTLPEPQKHALARLATLASNGHIS